MATGHVELLIGEMVGEGEGEGVAELGFDATKKIKTTKMDSILMSLMKLNTLFLSM